VPTGVTGGASPDLDFADMVDSLLITVWRRAWTRIFALAVLLGLWITAVVAGCSRTQLESRAFQWLSQTTDYLNEDTKNEICNNIHFE
jgi:hypothetical protein